MFTIENRKIGIEYEPYVIAELSANHNGSIDRAINLIKAAKDNGAHAVKLQTYTPDTMTINCQNQDFRVSGGIWDGYYLYDLYKEAYTPFEWHRELFEYAQNIGITLFSTPFDESAVDLLEALNAPAYKIASFELVDLPLIKYVAKTKKPILMSTGMASEEEILEAVTTAREFGCESILLFHCISSYPTDIEHANLKKIVNLRNRFGVEVGLSDHTLGSVASIASVAIGATAIEKHFTICRADGGADSQFSMEPIELYNLVRDTKAAWKAMGVGDFSRPISENSSLAFRRSIYFVNNLEAGQMITVSDIRRIRPGYGLSPKFFNQIIGMKVKRAVCIGDPVKLELLD